MFVIVLSDGRYNDRQGKRQPLQDGATLDVSPAYARALVQAGQARFPGETDDVPEGAILDVTDAAAKLAESLGLDVRFVTGTGQHGRVLKTDVLRAYSEAQQEQE